MRITKAQLERTDFLVLVLGALFDIAKKRVNEAITGYGSSYDYKAAHCKSIYSTFNKILSAWAIIRGGFSLQDYFNDVVGLDKVANSYYISEDIKKIIDFIEFNETIEAPDIVKGDYGYEYVKDLITFNFYD